MKRSEFIKNSKTSQTLLFIYNNQEDKHVKKLLNRINNKTFSLNTTYNGTNCIGYPCKDRPRIGFRGITIHVHQITTVLKYGICPIEVNRNSY